MDIDLKEQIDKFIVENSNTIIIHTYQGTVVSVLTPNKTEALIIDEDAYETGDNPLSMLYTSEHSKLPEVLESFDL